MGWPLRDIAQEIVYRNPFKHDVWDILRNSGMKLGS